MSSSRLLQMSGAVVDLIYRVESLPPAGGEARVLSSLIAAGGGFNAMVAAKRAGIDVSYGGVHGTGIFADIVRRALTEADIPSLQKPSLVADQSSCVVLVDDHGERTFISKEEPSEYLDAHLLTVIDLAGFDWLLLSGYGLAHQSSRQALSDWLVDLPPATTFIFDPSPLIAQIPKSILDRALAKARWVSTNIAEAAVLTGLQQPDAAARALSAGLVTDGGGAVVRCGARGCWLAPQHEEPRLVPGFAVDSIDTNGAGDTHVGAFIAALNSGAEPHEAARYANAAAALSTKHLGPATAPHDRETQALLDATVSRPSARQGRTQTSANHDKRQNENLMI